MTDHQPRANTPLELSFHAEGGSSISGVSVLLSGGEAQKIMDRQAGQIFRRSKYLLETTARQQLAGREKELDRLNSLVRTRKRRILVTGEAGFGKTAFLAHWLQLAVQEMRSLAYHFFSERSAEPVDRDGAYRSIIKQICELYNLKSSTYLDGHPSSALEQLLDEVLKTEESHLILVLDGLDEAANPFAPLPFYWDNKMTVIASIRSSSLTPGWTAWREEAEIINLTKLERGAIKALLQNADSNALRDIASRSDLVDRIEAATRGFPLYLHYLLEDLKQAETDGKSVEESIQQTPDGFTKYIVEEFHRLQNNRYLDSHYLDLLALLTVTLGPIEMEAVAAITELREDALGVLPPRVRRWVDVDGSRKIAKQIYSFAHPLLAIEFRELFPLTAPEMEAKLENYVWTQWQVGELYAPRYVVSHLKRRERWKDIVELVRNDLLLERQGQLQPDGALVLETLGYALEAAQRTCDGVALAGFILRLGYENELARKHPLSVAQEGKVKRAIEICKSFDTEHELLLLLVLHRYYSDRQDTDSKEIIWQQILTISKSRLNGAYVGTGFPVFHNQGSASLLIELLAPIGRLRPPEEFATVCVVLLKLEDLGKLVKRLVDETEAASADSIIALFDRALSGVNNIENRTWFQRQLDSPKVTLAQRLAHEGNTDRALQLAEGIVDDKVRAKVYSDIALELRTQGKEEQALKATRLAMESGDGGPDLDTLINILIVQTLLGTGEGEIAFAKRMFSDSLSESVENRWLWQSSLLRWKTETHQLEPQELTIASLRSLISDFQDQFLKTMAYLQLIEFETDPDDRSIDLGYAWQAAKKIPIPEKRFDACIFVIEQMVKIGRVILAQQSINELLPQSADAIVVQNSPQSPPEQSSRPIRQLCRIAQLQIRTGDTKSATDTLGRAQEIISKSLGAMDHLIFDRIEFALAQYQLGQTQECLLTLDNVVSDIQDPVTVAQRGVESLFRHKYMAHVATAYAIVNAIPKAKKALMEVIDSNERLGTVAKIMNSWNQEHMGQERLEFVGAALVNPSHPRDEIINTTTTLLEMLFERALAVNDKVTAAEAARKQLDWQLRIGHKHQSMLSVWRSALRLALLNDRHAAARGFELVNNSLTSLQGTIRARMLRELVEGIVGFYDGAVGSVLLLDTFANHVDIPDLARLWELVLRDIMRELGPYPDEFDDNFREPIELIQSESLHSYVSANWLDMLLVYWHCGEIESLENLLGAAWQSADSGDHVRIAAVLAAASWIGKWDWIEKVEGLNLPTDFPLQNWLLFDGSRHYFVEGNPQAARDLIERMDDPILLAKLLHRVLTLADPENIKALSNSIVQVWERVLAQAKNTYLQTTSKIGLAGAIARDGQYQKGLRMLEESVETFAGIRDWTDQV